MNRKLFFIAFVLGFAVCIQMQAQGYYDDDIYFNASKAKKEKAEAAQKKAEAKAASNYVQNKSVDFPGADTYEITGDLTRDVDEYNRRGPSASNKYAYGNMMPDSLLNGDFANTRRIERFHNPDIVEGSSDEDLQYLYYNDEQELQNAAANVTQVNVYLGSPWGWSWPYWSSRYWGPSWASWGWGPSWGWDPYWAGSWGWGPSWSWSWGWGPGWGPGWGFGWDYGWCPGWGHGWGPVWAGPSWGGGWHRPRPSSPGSMAVHGSSGNRGNIGNTGTRRGLGSRLGNSVRSRNPQGSGVINNNARPGQRPGANVGNSNRRPSRNSGVNTNNNSYRQSNRNTGNSNSGLGTRGGSNFGGGSSFGSGSRGGGFGGGGASGGGSRGRR